MVYYLDTKYKNLKGYRKENTKVIKCIENTEKKKKRKYAILKNTKIEWKTTEHYNNKRSTCPNNRNLSANYIQWC